MLILSIQSNSAQGANEQKSSENVKIYLLGEVHDNPQSHQLRMDFVRQLIDQGRRPVLVMEQFDRENQLKLEKALQDCRDPDCVVSSAGTKGWQWEFYKPFIQLALENSLVIIAGNLSNQDVRKVAFEGFLSVFDETFIQRYQLNQLPTQLINIQTVAIKDGHCGMLPEAALGPMTRSQIARDVWMAKVIQDTQSDLLILIAGNGHVRKDAGVYQWLSASMQSQTKVFGYVEYLRPNDSQWYDQAFLVKPHLREDPCLIFKKRQPTNLSPN